MAAITPQQLADGYLAWMTEDDETVRELFSLEFHDHVSQRGLEVFDVVGGWIRESFSDRRGEIHAAMRDGDRIMVWCTVRGTHVGNGLPRLRLEDVPVRGLAVAWDQVHFFRVADELVVEHWAVRDDYALIEDLKAG
jgi:predicted ester cyclase